MHDVVIAGGGLAGAALAIHLAERGRSVLVLEKGARERRKACGEGLFPYGAAELERLGVLERVERAGSPLRQLRFHAGGHTATATLGQGRPGLGIRRDVLDSAVRRRAEEAGVEVRTGITVNGLVIEGRQVAAFETDAGCIAGRAFAGADGLHSRVRRLARLEAGAPGKRYGVSAHVRLDRDPGDAVDVYFHEGYEVYRTPTGERSANVALLLEKRQMRALSGRLAEGYAALLRGHAAMQHATGLADSPLVAGPFPRRCSRAWRANLVLTGDAAGFFDGISGDGMSAALAMAPPAAFALDQYLDTGSYEAFRAYERERRRSVRDSNALARLSLTLARRPVLARMAVRNLGRRPAAFSHLAAIAADRSGFGSLGPRDLGGLLFGL